VLTKQRNTGFTISIAVLQANYCNSFIYELHVELLLCYKYAFSEDSIYLFGHDSLFIFDRWLRGFYQQVNQQ
jgi:hypothetical protein